MTHEVPQDVHTKDVLVQASEELFALGERLQAIELVFFSELSAVQTPLHQSKLQDLDLVIQSIADLRRVLAWVAAAQPDTTAVDTRPFIECMQLADMRNRLLGVVQDRASAGGLRDTTIFFD